MQNLRVAVESFRSTLLLREPTADVAAPGIPMLCERSGTLLGRTAALGALMEIHHTIFEATDSEEEYERRLAYAVEVAELASGVKEGGLSHGTLICAGVSQIILTSETS